LWYCVPAPASLRLYTRRSFEDQAAKLESQLIPDSDHAERDVTFFGLAERLEMDAQGRIPLPRKHLELAGLLTAQGAPPEVVIVGARDRLEVRDRAAWQAGLQERFAQLPTLASRTKLGGA
jgi:MraZ protein